MASLINKQSVTGSYIPEPPVEPQGKYEYNVCPICDDECDTIYKDIWGNICGCENCVKTLSADDVPECNVWVKI